MTVNQLHLRFRSPHILLINTAPRKRTHQSMRCICLISTNAIPLPDGLLIESFWRLTSMQTAPSSAESLSSSILLVKTELNSTHKKETLRHTNSTSVGSLPPAPPWFHSGSTYSNTVFPRPTPIPTPPFLPPLAPSLEFHLETRSQKVHTKKRQTTQIKRKGKNLPEWSFLSFVLTSPLSCQGVRSRYFWQFTVIERRKRRRSDQSTSPTQANGCSSTAAIVRVAILRYSPLHSRPL